MTLNSSWFTAPTSWEMRQDRGHFHAYCISTLATGTSETQQVPDVKIRDADDPARGVGYYIHPLINVPSAPCFSQPTEVKVARSFTHFTLLQSIITPSIGSGPLTLTPSRSWCNHRWAPIWTIFTKRQWIGGGKEALSSQPALFLSGPSLNFSCQILKSDMLSQVGDFVLAPILSKTATPSGFKALSSDAIKSNFSVHRKLANLVSVHP